MSNQEEPFSDILIVCVFKVTLLVLQNTSPFVILPHLRYSSSVTRVLVEEGQTKFTCAHDNARLVPIIYHDGEFDKADKDVLVLNARSSDSGLYACDFGDKKDNKVGVGSKRTLWALVLAGAGHP